MFLRYLVRYLVSNSVSFLVSFLVRFLVRFLNTFLDDMMGQRAVCQFLDTPLFSFEYHLDHPFHP